MRDDPHGTGVRHLASVPSPRSPRADSRAIRRFYWELARAQRAGGPAPAAALADPRLAAALAALRGARPDDPIRVACAIPLEEQPDVGAVLRAREALARHEIALDVWPQLPGKERFLNTTTAAQFQARLLPLLDALEGSDVGLALDIEPSESLSRAAWTTRDPRAPLLAKARSLGAAVAGVAKSVVDARQGRRDLTELARDLAARDLAVHAAVLPPILASEGDGLRAWTLGCPNVDVDGRPLFGLQAAMCYAPMARRLKGAWSRETEKQTLALWAARHRTRFDAVVVGLTATGILGDEPVYEDPALLAEDVRAMDALAYADVAVYALEGILFGPAAEPFALRPDVERWIAAAFGEG